MKVDVISELSNGGSVSMGDADQHCATDIGREFVRRYYTLLSETPASIFRFYSHESVFVHNELQAVGQKQIQKAIEALGFVECKVRIHSIKGAHTIGQADEKKGIVLQVCGEMAQSAAEQSRRFIQTFVLCQQTPKKFFVQNDIFQFVDQGFMEAEPKPSTPEPEQPALKAQAKAPAQNGHSNPSPKAAEAAPATAATKPHAEVAANVASPPAKKESKQEVEIPPPRQPTPVAPPAEAPAPAAAAPAPPPAAAAPAPPAPAARAEPKSWAKMVGGGGNSSSPHHPPAAVAPSPAAPAPAAPTPAAAPAAAPKPAVQPQQNGHTEQKGGDRSSALKLFVGGITRNKIPDYPSELDKVNAQFFQVFAEVAEVDNVTIPRKVFINEPGTERQMAFAFITMKSMADVDKVFAACRKDEHTNTNFIKMSLEAFGFDGEAHVSMSENKPVMRPGGFRGGRGGPGGSRGGGFAPRGRGGPRGGGGFHSGGGHQ